MQEPAEIDRKTFTAVDKRQNALTAMELKWDSKIDYQMDTYFIVEFDPSQIGP